MPLERWLLMVIGLLVVALLVQTYRIQRLENTNLVCKNSLIQVQSTIKEAQIIKQNQQSQINEIERENAVLENKDKQDEASIKNETIPNTCEGSLQWLVGKVLQFNTTYKDGII